MARSRRDVCGSRTTSVVARILACLGFEPEQWTTRQAYALAPRRQLAVSRVSGATWCGLGTARRRRAIYTAMAGEPPAPCMTENRRDA
jgi:hypothetical protein